MGKDNHVTGKSGEDIAVDHLRRQGYAILQRNYRSALGEIDIVAKDKGILVFIEVKSRHHCSRGAPEESVTLRKQNQISRAALAFLKGHDLLSSSARFDVVCVQWPHGQPEVRVIKNAFELNPRYTY